MMEILIVYTAMAHDHLPYGARKDSLCMTAEMTLAEERLRLPLPYLIMMKGRLMAEVMIKALNQKR